jgi:hypothetical protein
LILNAAFHYPAMIACLAADPHNRIDVPGLHLRTRPGISAESVRLPAPGLARFLYPVKHDHCASPVILSESRPLRWFPCRRSPPGPLDPSGS